MPRGVRRHGHVAARGAHDEHASAGQRAAGMKDLQRLAQRCQRVAAGDSRLAAEGVEGPVRAGEGAGMGARGAAAASVRPALTSAIGLPAARALCHRAREARGVLDAFDVEAERA